MSRTLTLSTSPHASLWTGADGQAASDMGAAARLPLWSRDLLTLQTPHQESWSLSRPSRGGWSVRSSQGGAEAVPGVPRARGCWLLSSSSSGLSSVAAAMLGGRSGVQRPQGPSQTPTSSTPPLASRRDVVVSGPHCFPRDSGLCGRRARAVGSSLRFLCRKRKRGQRL